MEVIKKWFKDKRVGFYISLASAVILLIELIVYSATFGNIGHLDLTFHVEELLFSLFGVLAFAGLVAFRQTREFAAAAVCLGQFLTFLFFVQHGYIYLSDAFFEIEGTAGFFRALGHVEPAFMFCLITLLIVWILSTVGIFMKNFKPQESQNTADGVSVAEEGTANAGGAENA